MIHIQNICLSFGSQTIFDHISCTINQDQRIGLVGLNGSGKSTFLGAIMGNVPLDEGYVTISSSKRIAYMPQQVVLASTKTILDEAYTAFETIVNLLQEQQTLEQQIHETQDPALVERLHEVLQHLEPLNPHHALIETQVMLRGLGFSEEQFQQSVQTLSVGWKMRLVLAKLLLQKADFYLFDEPTNHLDIFAKDWFLKLLKKAPFGFLLVCHERYFLNQLCDQILELERGKALWYHGNYTVYEEQKEKAIEAQIQAYNLQQKDIERKQFTIERFRASASKAAMAKSMEKALDKIVRLELPPSVHHINVRLAPPSTNPGKIVLTVHKVRQTFGNHELFHNVSFTINRGQKVALIAPNGVGKTTLFNIITGSLPLQSGEITFGYNVQYAIFAQDQDTVLNSKTTIIDELLTTIPHKKPEEIRTLLGAFLFDREDIQKKIKVLSGGEKNRVSMIKVLLQDANFLLLDEPTNHLDIPSKDILLKALKQYTGTILFVSHDHDFVNNLATNIIELTPKGTHTYEGNYNDYLHFKEATASAISTHSEQATTTKKIGTSKEPIPNKDRYEFDKEIKKLERKISDLERTIVKTETEFADLTYGTMEFNQKSKKLEKLKEELEDCFKQWEIIQDKLS